MESLSYEPVVTSTLWITLAVLTGAILAWYAWHRPAAVTRRQWTVIVALTATAAAGVLFILLNPVWQLEIPPPAGKPVLSVIIDDSASMAVADVGPEQSRYAAAVKQAAAIVTQLNNQYDVRLLTLSSPGVVRSQDELTNGTASGPVSDFTPSLSGALATDYPQGHAMVLLSDGIHNGPGGLSELRAVLRSAKSMNVPIHTATFGGDTVLKDLEVVAARPQELSFVRQRVPLTVSVRQRGRLTDRAVAVLLRNDHELERKDVTLPTEGPVSVRFLVQEDAAGLYRYEIRIEPVSGEATLANNTATTLLRVTESPVRALLLEGKPYWDGKFLLRTLAADPSLEVDSIVRVSESRFIRRSFHLPAPGASPSAASGQRREQMDVLNEPLSILEGPDGLSSCQVVILGRDADVYLTDRVVERLRTWISREGGSLVCFRGLPVSRASDQFARLLPVRWSPARETRFRPHLTERGRETDWLSAGSSTGTAGLEQLPSLATMASQERPKPMSVVLATSTKDGGPSVMTYQPYGTGRVVALEGSGMWRWAFLAPQYQELDDVYSGLWQNLLRWLVSGVGLIPGQDMALRAEKVNFVSGEPVTAFLLLRDDRRGTELPQVELKPHNSDSSERFQPVPIGDEPGVYRVALGTLPDGSYRIQTAGDSPLAKKQTATAAFDVRPYSGEQLDVQARPDLLAYIAAETSGTVLSQDSPSQLAQEFEKHLVRSRPTKVRRLTAWDRWWVLAGIIAIWGVTWGLRRSSGLI